MLKQVEVRDYTGQLLGHVELTKELEEKAGTGLFVPVNEDGKIGTLALTVRRWIDYPGAAPRKIFCATRSELDKLKTCPHFKVATK